MGLRVPFVRYCGLDSINIKYPSCAIDFDVKVGEMSWVDT